MKLIGFGLGTLAAAALVLSLNTVTVSTASAEIIILGKGGNQDNPGKGNQNGRRSPEERPVPGQGMGDGQGNANGRSPERQKGPDMGKLFDKCSAEVVVDDLGTEINDLMKSWHKDKNLRAYPIATGYVNYVTGTTFSILGDTVVVDASMALVSQPCWRPSPATDEAGNRVLPVLSGDRVYVRGRLQSNGVIAARYVRVHVPETDGILTGVVQLADATTGIFVVNGEAVTIDEQSVILKACGCENTAIQAGDSVRAHVNVVDTDSDGEPELSAVFVRVLHPATPNRPDNDDDDDDDNDGSDNGSDDGSDDDSGDGSGEDL